MMPRVLVTFVVLTLATTSADEQAEPGDLALDLDEDEFEDYLDAWLEKEYRKTANQTEENNDDGCILRVNGDLGEPQPVYLHNGSYIEPTGNTGQIYLNTGVEVTVACTGRGRAIGHLSARETVAVATVKCERDNLVSAEGFLKQPDVFGGFVCYSDAAHDAQPTSSQCFNGNLVIRVGFIVNDMFYTLYWSCFDQNRMEVLYVWYEQKPSNAVHQTNVPRPRWLVGGFFPGVGVDNRYRKNQQKQKISSYVGTELADKYVTNSQFLARGHLAAKTDFVFATGQRASFYYINAAPQWQPFNAGNWNWLEQNLRARIGRAEYHTMIYTGTFGVSQLRDQSDTLVDIYLHHDENNNPQLPVPLYFYKIVYDSHLRLGTAFVSINNPYYTEAEVRRLTFCTDRCRNNSAFSWLRWQPDRIDLGYSFCCTIDDFRRTIRHLPSFQVNGLLT